MGVKYGEGSDADGDAEAAFIMRKFECDVDFMIEVLMGRLQCGTALIGVHTGRCDASFISVQMGSGKCDAFLWGKGSVM